MTSRPKCMEFVHFFFLTFLQFKPVAGYETRDNDFKNVQESPLLHKYLDGLQGLEVGSSSHNGFGLNALNIDFTSGETKFSTEQLRVINVLRSVDVIARGNELPFAKTNRWTLFYPRMLLNTFTTPLVSFASGCE